MMHFTDKTVKTQWPLNIIWNFIIKYGSETHIILDPFMTQDWQGTWNEFIAFLMWMEEKMSTLFLGMVTAPIRNRVHFIAILLCLDV